MANCSRISNSSPMQQVVSNAFDAGVYLSAIQEILVSNVRLYLGKSGLTQREFASKSKVSESWLTKFLKGKANIELETLGRMAIALKVTPADLLKTGRTEEEALAEAIVYEIRKRQPVDKPTKKPVKDI